jgi:hypothetical protein
MTADILVGIFDESVIKYAVKLEYGDSGRDFLRMAYDSHLPEITDFVEREYAKVIDSMINKRTNYTIKNARINVGAFVVKLIKEKILEKNLIKTGNMYRSIEALINES